MHDGQANVYQDLYQLLKKELHQTSNEWLTLTTPDHRRFPVERHELIQMFMRGHFPGHASTNPYPTEKRGDRLLPALMAWLVSFDNNAGEGDSGVFVADRQSQDSAELQQRSTRSRNRHAIQRQAPSLSAFGKSRRQLTQTSREAVGNVGEYASESGPLVLGQRHRSHGAGHSQPLMFDHDNSNRDDYTTLNGTSVNEDEPWRLYDVQEFEGFSDNDVNENSEIDIGNGNKDERDEIANRKAEAQGTTGDIVFIRIGTLGATETVEKGEIPLEQVVVGKVDRVSCKVMDYRRVNTFSFHGLSIGECENSPEDVDFIDQTRYTPDPDFKAAQCVSIKALNEVLPRLARAAPGDAVPCAANLRVITAKAGPLAPSLDGGRPLPPLQPTSWEGWIPAIVSVSEYYQMDALNLEGIFGRLKLTHNETLKSFETTVPDKIFVEDGVTLRKRLESKLSRGFKLVIHVMAQVEGSETMWNWGEYNDKWARDWLDVLLEKRPHNERQLYIEVFVQDKMERKKRKKKRLKQAKQMKRKRETSSMEPDETDAMQRKGRGKGGKPASKARKGDQYETEKNVADGDQSRSLAILDDRSTAADTNTARSGLKAEVRVACPDNLHDSAAGKDKDRSHSAANDRTRVQTLVPTASRSRLGEKAKEVPRVRSEKSVATGPNRSSLPTASRRMAKTVLEPDAHRSSDVRGGENVSGGRNNSEATTSLNQSAKSTRVRKGKGNGRKGYNVKAEGGAGQKVHAAWE
ncbi:hypothetical protein LTR09_002536 [Extremus antarcticus]|uniref:Uncharacterized protein n=1 Tax=Extremus antarcticus TaxID=702011 RepID=A0AAJ0GG18_9PEZI|nr:hypothetical protein LTR09_002536 [Extremus antarcticus]